MKTIPALAVWTGPLALIGTVTIVRLSTDLPPQALGVFLGMILGALVTALVASMFTK